MTTWNALMAKEMERAEDPGPVLRAVVKHGFRSWEDEADPATWPAPSMDREFDAGYGGAEGDYFTAWTETRVYFPVVYDGAESVGSAPRNPCDEACEHVGGQ